MSNIISGVYAIYLTGTPFVYIGESTNVAERWRNHAKEWVSPNEAEYVLVRAMEGASKAERLREETASTARLRGQGFIILSMTDESQRLLHSDSMKKIHAGVSAAVRRERAVIMGNASVAGLTKAQLQDRVRPMREAFTQEDRNASMKTMWAGVGAEERRRRVANAVLAMTPEKRRKSAAIMNEGVTRDERIRRAKRSWITRRANLAK